VALSPRQCPRQPGWPQFCQSQLSLVTTWYGTYSIGIVTSEDDALFVGGEKSFPDTNDGGKCFGVGSEVLGEDRVIGTISRHIVPSEGSHLPGITSLSVLYARLGVSYLRKGILEHPSLGRVTRLMNFDVLGIRVHLSSREGRGDGSTGQER
jgi:hypothetical protein